MHSQYTNLYWENADKNVCPGSINMKLVTWVHFYGFKWCGHVKQTAEHHHIGSLRSIHFQVSAVHMLRVQLDQFMSIPSNLIWENHELSVNDICISQFIVPFSNGPVNRIITFGLCHRLASAYDMTYYFKHLWTTMLHLCEIERVSTVYGQFSVKSDDNRTNWSSIDWFSWSGTHNHVNFQVKWIHHFIKKHFTHFCMKVDQWFWTEKKENSICDRNF